MDTEEISKYIFLEDGSDLTADVAIVFGTWHAHREAVEKATSLYRKGFVNKILTTGGPNENAKYIEGEEMAKELHKNGIPKGDILIENKAMNTLESVIFSLSTLDKALGLQNIKSIVAVVKTFHSRRALMTLKKNSPSRIHLKVASYESSYYAFTSVNWDETDQGREKVMGEMERIEKYLKKGDIAEL